MIIFSFCSTPDVMNFFFFFKSITLSQEEKENDETAKSNSDAEIRFS